MPSFAAELAGHHLKPKDRGIDVKTATQKKDKHELVIYQTEDGSISIDVKTENNSNWKRNTK